VAPYIAEILNLSQFFERIARVVSSRDFNLGVNEKALFDSALSLVATEQDCVVFRQIASSVGNDL
jgi:hypothetical protein